MASKIIKFRDPNKKRVNSGLLAIFAFSLAVFSFLAFFETLKFFGILFIEKEDFSGPLHGAAMERVIYEPKPAAEEKDVKLEVGGKAGGYAYLGEENVDFLSLTFTSQESGRLHDLVLSVDGFARPTDIKSLQIYVDEKFIAEKPVFEGKAIFSGLNIDMDAHFPREIDVRGVISDEALSGDRVVVGIMDEGDIALRNGLSRSLSIDGEFPVWGSYVSVIGGRI